MTRPFDINTAHDYLSDTLDEATARQYEEWLSVSATGRAELSEARSARMVWAMAQAPIDQLESTEWARFDRKTLRAVLEADQDAAAVSTPLFGAGRALAWGSAAVALIIGVVVYYRAEAPSQGEVEPAAQLAAEVETGEQGAIYAAGRTKRVVRVAEARVTIAPDAACQVSRVDDGSARLDVLAGAVHFKVDKRAPGKTFRVGARDVLVTVVGTAFTVRVHGQGMVQVEVDEGLVTVAQDGAQRARLTAGESLMLTEVSKAVVESDGEDEHAHHRPAPARPRDVETPKYEAGTDEETPTDTSTATQATVVHAEASSAVGAPSKVVRRASVRKRRGVRAALRAADKTSPEPRTVEDLPDLDAVLPGADDAEAVPAREHVKGASTAVSVERSDERAAPREKPEEATDAATVELTRILSRLPQSPLTGIKRLKAWKQANPGHRKQVKASYAIGWAHHKLGQREAALSIFERLPRSNPWVRDLGDYMNPPRPR